MGLGSPVALVAFAWVAVGVLIGGASFAVELSLNLFDWRPSLSLRFVAAIGLYAAGLAASVALHRVTRGALPMATAVVVTLMLAAIGVSHLPAETLSPDSFLGRKLTSPLAYRVAFALALMLPATLLVIRRWSVDASDAWLRKRAARLIPPCALLALGLSATSLVGRRANDPAPYTDAVTVLGGPSGIAIVAELAVTVFLGLLGSSEKLAPPKSAAVDHRELLEQFFRSDRVSAPIKDEVRAACRNTENPAQTQACAHRVLSDGRDRAQRKRDIYDRLAGVALPIGAFAIAVGWRARRPRESN